MGLERLRVALIGSGRIGKVHAENLAYRVPRADLVALSDLNPSAAQETADRFRIPRVTLDYRELLSDPSIDAIVICSATDTHARIISEAAAARKHVFCEKPIAQNLPDIDQALAAVRQAQVKLQIGFNRRFDANFSRVRQAVSSGEIGVPHLLHIISRDPAPPSLDYIKVSGGIFLDMTIHDFDMARFLLGDEVSEVYTTAGVRVDPGIGEAGDLDTALIVLKFAHGAIGTIDNCRKAVYGYDQRVEILGSLGSIQVQNNYPNQAVISSQEHVRRDLPLHFFLERYRESFVSEMQSFVDSVLEDRPPAVTGTDGKIPVVMALAARRSFDEKRPVKLSEIDLATP